MSFFRGVTNMHFVFSHSRFDGDISHWNASSITDMSRFSHSKFNGDISQWEVSNVTNTIWMYFNSKFT
jgi:hypothetical protein